MQYTISLTTKKAEEIENEIMSIGAQPARLYGLSNVHKNSIDPPYRPSRGQKISPPLKNKCLTSNILNSIIFYHKIFEILFLIT